MKILMVAPFPPLRDGVGRYAAQEVAALREEGHDVEVLAPAACAAHHVEDFKTWRGGLARLRGYARRYDRVILQYQPAHFHWKSEGPARAASNFWMMVAFRTIRNLEIVCHEIEYPAPAWPRWRPEVFFDRMAWAGARHVEFHTDHEIEEMRRHLGVTPRHTELRAHGRYFRPSVTEDRAAARRRLGLPETLPILLCIGFVQPHKGFDRALRAFRRVPGDARLYVVGSVGTETAAHRGHVEELHHLAATDERAEVRERMVSDDEFDRWILASDVVVLPYREIWSSGVLERARVLNRPVIASAAGGMREQLRPGDTTVSTDEDLAVAMANVVGAGPPVVPEPMGVSEAIAYVEEETRRRGAWVGGTSVDRALHTLSSARGVHPITLPSRRRYIGRFLDLAKRVMRRGLGWLLTPLLGQLNYFQDLTVEALEEIVALQRRSRSTAAGPPEDEEATRARVRAYLDELGVDGPILHVGCGRRDVVDLLRSGGSGARAVEPAPEGLGGVLATVDDADLPSLDALLAAARPAIRPGGVLIVEPTGPAGREGASGLVAMAVEAGFVEVEFRRLPRRPPRVGVDAGADAPEWAQRLAKNLDEELDALSDQVFGSTHAVIARAP